MKLFRAGFVASVTVSGGWLLSCSSPGGGGFSGSGAGGPSAPTPSGGASAGGVSSAGASAGSGLVAGAGGGSAAASTAGGTGGFAGGAGGMAGGGGVAGTGGATSSGQATFVAVGYAGRRVRSTDLGLTWVDEQMLGGGGDDEFLLRGVGFGAGVFVAVGWKILSSPDGKTWTEHDNPQNQWLAGIQFNGSLFVATGGFGYAASSTDGKSWSAAESVPNNEASRSLAFGAGKFVTATDPGNWFETTDGMSWSLLSGGHDSNQVAFCGDEFKEYGECSGAFNARGRASATGVTIRLSGGRLERSTDGVDFQEIDGSPSGLEDVAVGFVD